MVQPMFALFEKVTLLDCLAFAWLVVCWGGYAWYSEKSGAARNGLVGISRGYRHQWADALLRREIRVSDAALIGNLMSTVSFYANTTIYIIAGLFALLGTLDKVINIAADLPFSRHVVPEVVEMKLMVLLVIFVIAYFKFTWSLRLFNMQTILVGAAPLPSDPPDPVRRDAFCDKLATINSLAGDDFNRGIRAYYFGLATVTWMIQPWLFLAFTTAILVVLARRDFLSDATVALRQ